MREAGAKPLSLGQALTLCYLAGIHVVLGLALLKSDFLERVGNRLGLAAVGRSEIGQYHRDMVEFHSRMDGNVPTGSIVFIGDSLVQSLCVAAVAPLSVNYGIGGDTTIGVLQRLAGYRSIARAGALVLAVGINDVAFRENAEIISNYRAILEGIPRRIPVVVSAILPVDEKVRPEWRGRNQRIQALNTDLKALSGQRCNAYFVDVGPLLADGQGNLAKTYYKFDGLHINSEGNAIWIDALRAVVKAVLKTGRVGPL